MSPMSSFFFLFPLALCITLTLAHQQPAAVPLTTTAAAVPPGAGLITKACELAAHKDFCINVMNQNPNSQKSDLKQLAFIALDAASVNASAASEFIQKALADPNLMDLDPTVQQTLADCSENYQIAVEQIDDSVNALVTKSISNDQVETWVKAAVAAVDTCDAGAKAATGKGLELSQKNRIVRQLCNNAMSVYRVFASVH